MSSMSRWPRARRQARHRRISASLPRMTRLSCPSASPSRMRRLEAGSSFSGDTFTIGLPRLLLQFLEPRELRAHLLELTLQGHHPFAHLFRDLRGRIAQELLVSEARLGARQVLLRLLAQLREPRPLGAKVLLEPTERDVYRDVVERCCG